MNRAVTQEEREAAEKFGAPLETLGIAAAAPTICHLPTPASAAGDVLKYLRRTKDPEHSLESAKRYYARLTEHADPINMNSWMIELVKLRHLLTADEKRRLGTT